MRRAKRAALDVLAKSAEVYNCWSILDEAVTCGERDGFTREYVEGEREMLVRSIDESLHTLRVLGDCYGITVAATTIPRKWEARQ